jgi:hypothetical protein
LDFESICYFSRFGRRKKTNLSLKEDNLIIWMISFFYLLLNMISNLPESEDSTHSVQSVGTIAPSPSETELVQ